jgi:phosphoribosylglycinamide formyltransferase 1
MRLGVLVSGQGTNLRNLVDRGFEVVGVATNKPSCGGAAFARERAIAVGEFPQKAFPSHAERDAAMRDWMLDRQVELVVNAGYDRILTSGFIAAFEDRMINIHPSLLPAFAGGMDAVAQALARGVTLTGCTVHLVTEEVDAGPILLQAAVPVLPGDTVETLHARIQVEEHRILPEAIEMLKNRIAPARAPLR